MRRLAQLVPAVVGILLVGFMLLHAAPGDPILALAGEDGDAAYYAFMRERFGLDRPLPIQFLAYAGSVLSGDLGVSFAQGRPVLELIASRLWATLLLTGTALLISTVVGIGLGVFAARRAGTRADVAVNAATLVSHAAPDFWLGQIALILFAGGLGWFPVQGMFDARGVATGVPRLLDLLHHLSLPALVLASSQVALLARLTRTALIEEAAEPYVRTAKSKGLVTRRVVYVHALRRALLPAVTVVGGRIGHLLAGTAVVEVVFGWPGIGRLLLTAMQSRDHPVLLGLFLVIGFAVVLANLVTDLVYGWVDPRIVLDRD